MILAAGGMGEHEAARPEPREGTFGGKRRQHGTDGGVERVPALAQDLRSGFGCDVVARCNDTLHRWQRSCTVYGTNTPSSMNSVLPAWVETTPSAPPS